MEIERVKEKLTKIEKKELLIFLLVAFGIPFLMGIPLAILYEAGKDTFNFAVAQMFYPAAGLMLAKLICSKDKSMLPKKFFGGFLLLTLFLLLWCFAGFFLPDETTEYGFTFLTSGGTFVLLILYIGYLIVDEEKLSTYGLAGKNWKPSCVVLGLFLLLYFSLVFISVTLTADAIVAGRSLLQMIKNLSLLLGVFPVSFSLYLGEEYGWRYYFQPFLQKKFGLIKGVLLFGVLWGLWHFPLDLFYFSPEAPMLGIIGHQVVCISLGIFMAYAYMKTNHVWVPVLIHYLYNNLSVFFMNELKCTWGFMGISALIYFALFLPFLCSKVFRKQVTTQDHDTQI